MWNRERIVADLRGLRIREGDALIVHASMRAIGEVEGGADAVIAALLEVVGPEGTLMAPAFNMDHYAGPDWIAALDDPQRREQARSEPFDADGVCVSQVGILPALLRQGADARASRHPVVSFCAVGRNAAFLTENAPFHYPLGTDSPLARLHQLNGGILLLGTDHTVSSTLHLAEVWADAPYARRACRVKTSAQTWAEMQGSPECSAGFSKIEPVLRQVRILREGPVGNAPSQYMRVQHMVSMALDMLRGDAEALLCDDPTCRWCVAARKFTAKQR